jgi:ubiquinone biosynthesis monooxygenase Coq7
MSMVKAITDLGYVPARVVGPAEATPSSGDRAVVAAAIRVNHAGEYGAVRIYEGQLAVLGHLPSGIAVREMHGQELEHLATFTGLLNERQVRPTALLPL